jgi:hypothetical protein
LDLAWICSRERAEIDRRISDLVGVKPDVHLASGSPSILIFRRLAQQILGAQVITFHDVGPDAARDRVIAINGLRALLMPGASINGRGPATRWREWMRMVWAS